eukprot:TRINITY_DN10669_c0_g1_i1.p1 TRINITY_DN10669_c0_g1~~TRINITY_DN10669_c0_g1_i1.p1  ORF type:complete len:187 (-),score=30.94 TRINITY_DN10669_c0_g1_i1:51-611(-)
MSNPFQDILQTAQKLGYSIPEPVNDTNNISFLKLLKQIRQLKTEIQVTSDQIKQREILSKNYDVLAKEYVEDKIETLKTLSTHLNNILKNKDVLISYLQQPFAGDFVVVEADNQQHVYELFVQMGDGIRNLSKHLALIDWASSFNLNDGVLERTLNSLTAFLAKCQRYSESLQQMKQTVLSLEQVY